MLRSFLRRPPAALFRARLNLETLDGRLLPSASPLPPPPGPPSADIVPAHHPPVITSFTAVEVGPGLYRFTGTVAADNPAGLVVSFGGEPPSVQGQTATVDADGTFSILINLR